VGISDYARGWKTGLLLLVGREIFLFVTLPTLALGPASRLLAKRQDRESDRLSASGLRRAQPLLTRLYGLVLS
jgi:hypothetical protein